MRGVWTEGGRESRNWEFRRAGFPLIIENSNRFRELSVEGAKLEKKL